MSREKRQRLFEKRLSVRHARTTLPFALAVESDRGCALVAAEFLSNELEMLIRSKFDREMAAVTMQDELLSHGMAPLSSIGLRAKVARCFGLIEQDVYEAIDAVRRIRNECGHCPRPIDLGDDALVVHVQWLAAFVERYPSRSNDGSFATGWDWWDKLGVDATKFSHQRLAFMNAVSTIFAFLSASTFYLNQGPKGRKYRPKARKLRAVKQSPNARTKSASVGRALSQ